MADEIILTRLDDDAVAIVEEFSEQTGLEPEEHKDKWVFPVHDDEHGIDVVQTLTAIDETWTDHVGFEMPE